ASWTHPQGPGTIATTVVYGRNNKEGADFTAVLGESTYTVRSTAAYGRIEALQVEDELLRSGVHAFVGDKKDVPDNTGRSSVVTALTAGGVRTVGRWGGWDLGAGADVTVYRVPTSLQPTHGAHPVSFHVYLRVRPPAPMGRMVDGT